MIYKTVDDKGAEGIRNGYLRIGSLYHYKHHEDESRRDELEGIPDKVLGGKGQVITAEEFSNISQSVGAPFLVKGINFHFQGKGKLILDSHFNVHVYCTSIGSPELKERNSEFGKHIFEIIDPDAFSELVASALFAKYQNGELEKRGNMDSIDCHHKKVVYLEEKENKSYASFDKGTKVGVVDIEAAFTKTTHFRDQSEYRFVWAPYSVSKSLHCALPHNHEYIDIKIDNLENYIRWL